jgi:hypothetical protein
MMIMMRVNPVKYRLNKYVRWSCLETKCPEKRDPFYLFIFAHYMLEPTPLLAAIMVAGSILVSLSAFVDLTLINFSMTSTIYYFPDDALPLRELPIS